jgi:hypothetical protein
MAGRTQGHAARGARRGAAAGVSDYDALMMRRARD